MGFLDCSALTACPASQQAQPSSDVTYQVLLMCSLRSLKGKFLVQSQAQHALPTELAHRMASRTLQLGATADTAPHVRHKQEQTKRVTTHLPAVHLHRLCCPPQVYDFLQRTVLDGARLRLPTDDDVCPIALRRLIEGCWEVNPEDRPSASEVASELERLHTYWFDDDDMVLSA